MTLQMRLPALTLSTALLFSLVSCGDNAAAPTPSNTTNTSVNSGTLAFDNAAWSYDADNDVWWQLGVVYCTAPEAEEYESLGIYVPGPYLIGTENGDGTYTCAVSNEASVNGYTAATAPVVLPVNTAGYSAQKAPTQYSYSGLSSYLDAGFIYVYAGCRGRSNGYDEAGTLTYSGGAPWGVTDLKAAVRYLRYNADILPGDTKKVFTFGHSGGGAQSSLMGATGDSTLYVTYLESIGAAMTDAAGNTLSDAIMGAMCWCPITSLDYADAAYEWMLGQYSDENTRADGTFTAALSDDLSTAFAEYINALGLTDEDGTVLTLTESDGIYTSGSYYDYLLGVVGESLNHFLADNTFPYTSGGNFKADGGFAGAGGDMGGERPEGGRPDRELPDGELPEGMTAPDGELPEGMTAPDGERPQGGPNGGSTESVTYATIQEYIDSLNADGEWVTYDAATNIASITSLEAFVTHCKTASKSVGAFDDLARSQAENMVFGDDTSDALHFDSVMAELLEQNQEEYATYADWDASYVSAYQEYLTSVDAYGTDSLTRQTMYNPMYFISDCYEGYGSATVAPYWRIRTGIEQGDTASTVEVNLALALEANDAVKDVDFETVWEQAHTTAERTGDSTTNFIHWVNTCCADA